MRTTLIATLVLTLLGQAGAHAADDQFTTNQPSLQDTDREAVSADDRLMIQAEGQGDMGFASATLAERDDVIPAQDVCTHPVKALADHGECVCQAAF